MGCSSFYQALEPGALPINPALLKYSWQTQSVTHRDGPHRDFGLFHCRRPIEMPAVPAKFVVKQLQQTIATVYLWTGLL
jgi:hypothetical protein